MLLADAEATARAGELLVYTSPRATTEPKDLGLTSGRQTSLTHHQASSVIRTLYMYFAASRCTTAREVLKLSVQTRAALFKSFACMVWWVTAAPCFAKVESHPQMYSDWLASRCGKGLKLTGITSLMKLSSCNSSTL